MKRVLLIGLIVALVLILVGGAGVVYAQVRGIENRVVVTVNTAQNKATILRQFGSDKGIIITGDGLNLMNPGGKFGLRIASGFMMQGFDQCPGGYGYGNRPRGMMQGYGPGFMMKRGQGCGVAAGQGLLHDYMLAAFAEALDLKVEDVETRLADGKTLREIATAQGFTQDELKDLVTKVRQAALDAAVADEVITQAQADFMLERMEKYMGPGFGPGFKPGFNGCPMWDSDEVPLP